MDFVMMLPKEIVAQILEFLDMNSICVCMAVSKSWSIQLSDLNLKNKIEHCWKNGEPSKFKRKLEKFQIQLEMCKI